MAIRRRAQFGKGQLGGSAFSGAESFEAAGSLTAPCPTIEASGTLMFSGTGSVTAPAPSLAAVEELAFVGSAELEALAASVQAIGLVVLNPTPPSPIYTGGYAYIPVQRHGKRRIVGRGSLVAPAASLYGVGTVTEPFDDDALIEDLIAAGWI